MRTAVDSTFRARPQFSIFALLRSVTGGITDLALLAQACSDSLAISWSDALVDVRCLASDAATGAIIDREEFFSGALALGTTGTVPGARECFRRSSVLSSRVSFH